MHLWWSYFLSSQQGWITYHVIPGIKAKLITQVIIILTSNDMLRGPYWFRRNAAWSFAWRGDASTAPALCKIRSAGGKKKANLQSASFHAANLICGRWLGYLLSPASDVDRLMLVSQAADWFWSLCLFNSLHLFIPVWRCVWRQDMRLFWETADGKQ